MSHESICYCAECAPKFTDYNVDLHIRLPIDDDKNDQVLALLAHLFNGLEAIGIAVEGPEVQP
jgi:hypothetical protein